MKDFQFWALNTYNPFLLNLLVRLARPPTSEITSLANKQVFRWLFFLLLLFSLSPGKQFVYASFAFIIKPLDSTWKKKVMHQIFHIHCGFRKTYNCVSYLSEEFEGNLSWKLFCKNVVCLELLWLTTAKIIVKTLLGS